MKILVQKYGGTSTSTPQTRAYIYEKISSVCISRNICVVNPDLRLCLKK